MFKRWLDVVLVPDGANISSNRHGFYGISNGRVFGPMRLPLFPCAMFLVDFRNDQCKPFGDTLASGI